ncbi:ribonuclease H-like protein, partial [Hymenopellis radicata]
MLDSTVTPEHALIQLYGLASTPSQRLKRVYCDGSCLSNGSSRARAGAGIFFGRDCSMNISIRVTGPQTNNRGELLAILKTLQAVPAHFALQVFTDSEYAIRAIVYWAPKHALTGWTCENADLLKSIAAWLKARTAQLFLVHVKAHSGILGNEEADRLAKIGA